jgi:hypothetical protein
MGYLDRLKKSEKGAGGYPKEPKEFIKPNCLGFLGTPPVPFEKSWSANEAVPQTQTPARHWLLHYPDQNPREVFRSPPATHAEVLADNPSAIAAEPFPDQVVDQGGPAPARGIVHTVVDQDDRHRCADCQSLTQGGVCRIAAPGATVSAVRGHRPISTMLVRCPGFRDSHE